MTMKTPDEWLAEYRSNSGVGGKSVPILDFIAAIQADARAEAESERDKSQEMLDEIVLLTREYRKHSTNGTWREWLDIMNQRPLFAEPPSSVVSQICSVLCLTTLDLVKQSGDRDKALAANKLLVEALKKIEKCSWHGYNTYDLGAMARDAIAANKA